MDEQSEEKEDYACPLLRELYRKALRKGDKDDIEAIKTIYLRIKTIKRELNRYELGEEFVADNSWTEEHWNGTLRYIERQIAKEKRRENMEWR